MVLVSSKRLEIMIYSFHIIKINEKAFPAIVKRRLFFEDNYGKMASV